MRFPKGTYPLCLSCPELHLGWFSLLNMFATQAPRVPHMLCRSLNNSMVLSLFQLLETLLYSESKDVKLLFGGPLCKYEKRMYRRELGVLL